MNLRLAQLQFGNSNDVRRELPSNRKNQIEKQRMINDQIDIDRVSAVLIVLFFVALAALIIWLGITGEPVDNYDMWMMP